MIKWPDLFIGGGMDADSIFTTKMDILFNETKSISTKTKVCIWTTIRHKYIDD